MPDEGNIAYLYNIVHDKKMYSKSFDDFKKDYATPKAQEYLHGLLQNKKIYSKDYATFQSQYFTEPKAAQTEQATAPEKSPSDTLKAAALMKFDTDPDKITPAKAKAVEAGKTLIRDKKLEASSTIEAFKPAAETLTSDALRLMDKDGVSTAYYRDMLGQGALNEYDRYQLEATGAEMGIKSLQSTIKEVGARVDAKQKEVSDKFAQAQILKAQGKEKEYNKVATEYNQMATALQSDPDAVRLKNLGTRYKELVDYAGTIDSKYPNIKKEIETRQLIQQDYEKAKADAAKGLSSGRRKMFYYQVINPVMTTAQDMTENAVAGVGALAVQPFVNDHDWRNHITAFKGSSFTVRPEETTELIKDGSFNYEAVLPTMIQTAMQSYGFFKGGQALGGKGISQVASVAIQTQPEYMQQAYAGGLKGKDAAAYSWTMGMIQGLTERILPEERIFGATAIARKMTPKHFASLSGNTTSKMTAFMKEALKITGLEQAEEIAAYIAEPQVNKAANKFLDGQFANTSYDAQQLLNTVVTTGVGMVPMAVIGGVNGVSALTKVARYEAGRNADRYIEWINSNWDLFSKQKQQQLIDQVTAMKGIVDKLPEATPTGRQLSYSEKAELASAILERTKAKAIAANTDESVAVKFEEQMKEIDKSISDIMEDKEPDELILSETERADLDDESQVIYEDLVAEFQSPTDDEEATQAEQQLKKIRTDYDTFRSSEESTGLFKVEPLTEGELEGGVEDTKTETPTDETTKIEAATAQPAVESNKTAESQVDEVVPTRKKDVAIDSSELIANVVGSDAEYNGVIGTIAKDDEGNFVFDDGTKQTILPVADKTSPAETIGDLGITVAPQKLDKGSVAVITKQGDVSYRNRKYFVSFTNDPGDSVGTRVFEYTKNNELKQVGKQSKVNDIIQQFKEEQGIGTTQQPLKIKGDGLRNAEVQKETPTGVPEAVEATGSETTTGDTSSAESTTTGGAADDIADKNAMAHQLFNKDFSSLNDEEKFEVETAVDDARQFDEQDRAKQEALQNVDAQINSTNAEISAMKAAINAPKAVYLSENEAARMYELHTLYVKKAKLLLKKGFIKTGITFDQYRRQFADLKDKLGKQWNDNILRSSYDEFTGAAKLNTARKFLDHLGTQLSTQPAPISTPGERGKVIPTPAGKVDSEVMTALREEMKNMFAEFKKGIDKAASISKQLVFTVGHRELVRKTIKDFFDKTEISGKLSQGQIRKIVNWSNRIKTVKGVWKFLDYTEKIINDANYDDKISRAAKARKFIKKQVKKSDKTSKPSPYNQTALRKFTAINPAAVDIDEYLSYAEQIVEDLKGIKMETTPSGAVTISNAQKLLSPETIDTYTELKLGEQEEAMKAELLNDFDVLRQLGLIDDTMSLRDIQDVVEAYTGTPMTGTQNAAQKANELKALQLFLDDKKQFLDDYLNDPDNDDLTIEERAIITALKNVNTASLSLKELRKFNDVIDNILNNDDFTGSGSVVAKSKAKTAIAIAKLREVGKRINDLSKRYKHGRWATSKLDNRAIMIENIFLSTTLTAEMQDILGIAALYNAHGKVEDMQDKFIDGIEKIKKSLDEQNHIGAESDRASIDSVLNRIARGMYMAVDQWYVNDERGIAEAFSLHKGWAEQSIANARKAGNDKLADAYQEAYDLVLANADNAADVRRNIDALNPGNSKIVDYIKGDHGFAGRVEQFKTVAEVYHATPFDKVFNYAPIFKVGQSTKEVASFNNQEVSYLQNLFNNLLDSRGSKSRIKRAEERVMDEGYVLDYDADATASRKYYENNYDIEVTPIIQQLVEIFNDEDAAKIFGSVYNKDMVYKYLARSIVAQKGLGVNGGELGIVADALDFAAKQGARIALYSGFQVIKQYASVADSAMVNLWGDAMLFPKAVARIISSPEGFDKLIAQSETGRRGKTKAGLEKVFNVRDIQGIDLDKKDYKEALKDINKWYDETGEALAHPLVWTDVKVAQHSWYAFYLQYLKKQGIDPNSIDLDTEWQHPNTAAMSYAEQQVSRLQVASNRTAGSDIHKDRQDLSRLLWTMVMPFSSFGLNQIRRISLDVRKLQYKETRNEALKSLGATLTEQIVFNTIKQFILQPLAYGVANLITGGGDDDEDDKVNKAEENLWKFTANVLADFFLSGMAFVSRYAIEGIIDNIADRKRKLYYHKLPENEAQMLTTMTGIYGIYTVRTPYDIYSLWPVLDGKDDQVIVGGTKPEIEPDMNQLTQRQQAIVQGAFALNILSMLGLSDQFATTVMQKASRDVLKKVREDDKAIIQFKNR